MQHTEAHNLFGQTMVGRVSNGMEPRNMDVVLQIPVAIVDSGANVGGALGQCLLCTMHHMSHDTGILLTTRQVH